jgi:tetratricopeptide (TPR) repeat protein
MQKLAAGRLAAAADREASITRALREEQQRRTQSEQEIQAVQQQRQLDNLGRDALALLLRGEYGPGSRKLAQALDQLKIRRDTAGQVLLLLSAGAAFQQKGNPAAAESHLLAAMEEMARLPQPDPSLTIELHAHLASTSRALHRPADAMLHLQQVLTLREQMWKPDEQRLIPLLQDLALTAFDLQQFDMAESVCSRIMAIRSAHALERSPQAVDDLSLLALAQVRQGKFDHAGSACKLILTIEPVLDDAQKARLRRALMQLAHLYIEKSHFEQGLILLERALAIPRETASAESDDMDDWRLLAKLCLRERRFDQAEAIFKKLIAAREASSGSDDPLLADDASELAELYERRNQLGEAEALYKLAMSIRERVLGPWHPDVARSAMRLADLFRIQGKAAEADALYQLAREIRSQSPDTARP